MPTAHQPLLRLPLLFCLVSLACAPDAILTPADESVAAAKGGKPGGGGGGTPAGPTGQLLGSPASKATASNARFTVGNSSSNAMAWDSDGSAMVLPVAGFAGPAGAEGINSAGTIVGTIGEVAVVWSPAGDAVWSPPTALPQPEGSWSSLRAYDVNETGDVAGTGTAADGLRFAVRWLYDGTGYAAEVVPAVGAGISFIGYAIANSTRWVAGTVVHTVDGRAERRGFVWTDTHVIDLGRYDGAATDARDINAAGVVVGSGATAPRGGDSSPLKWTCSSTGCGAPVVLPALARNVNFVFGVTDAGDMVGTSGLSGILYPRCSPDSPIVLSPPAGWHQSYGWSIGEDGTTAAGYSFPEGGGTVQATRWVLPDVCP